MALLNKVLWICEICSRNLGLASSTHGREKNAETVCRKI